MLSSSFQSELTKWSIDSIIANKKEEIENDNILSNTILTMKNRTDTYNKLIASIHNDPWKVKY